MARPNFAPSSLVTMADDAYVPTAGSGVRLKGRINSLFWFSMQAVLLENLGRVCRYLGRGRMVENGRGSQAKKLLTG